MNEPTEKIWKLYNSSQRASQIKVLYNFKTLSFYKNDQYAIKGFMFLKLDISMNTIIFKSIDK